MALLLNTSTGAYYFFGWFLPLDLSWLWVVPYLGTRTVLLPFLKDHSCPDLFFDSHFLCVCGYVMYYLCTYMSKYTILPPLYSKNLSSNMGNWAINTETDIGGNVDRSNPCWFATDWWFSFVVYPPSINLPDGETSSWWHETTAQHFLSFHPTSEFWWVREQFNWFVSEKSTRRIPVRLVSHIFPIPGMMAPVYPSVILNGLTSDGYFSTCFFKQMNGH